MSSLRYFSNPFFVTDSTFESQKLDFWKRKNGFNVEAIDCTHWADGSAGAENLARAVVDLCESGQAQFRTLYDDALPLWEKIDQIAQNLYGADEIIADQKVRNQNLCFKK